MRRIAALTAGALVALATLLVPARADGQAALTRVELHLTSSSDWAATSIRGGYVLGRRVLEQSTGSVVSQNGYGFTLRAPAGSTATATATVVLVLKVPAAATPELRVSKGWVGDATTELVRNDTAPAQLATLTAAGKTTSATAAVDRTALVGEGASTAPVDPRHLVLAFYYPWFDRSSFTTRPWWEQPVGPYATDDPGDVAAMVDEARGSGIDGFVVSWNGNDTNNRRYDLVADAAAARGFAVAPYLELRGSGTARALPDIGAMLTPLVARLGDAAALRTPDGRPVLFVYGAWSRTPAEWRQAMDGLAAQGVHPFVVGDDLDPAFGFDGYHLYSPNGINDSDLARQYAENAQKLRVPALVDPAVQPRLWAATVSPGQNDLLIRPTSPTIRDRAGGGRYDTVWKAALASSPEWVMITSWNEWYEGTEITPGTRTGSLALRQTADWAALFHSS